MVCRKRFFLSAVKIIAFRYKVNNFQIRVFQHFHFQSGQVQASDAVCISSPASPLPILNTHTNIVPPYRERSASRRDAASLTEAVGNAKSTGTWDPHHWRRRRWQLCRPKDPYSSEEELITDKEEELEFRHRRRKDRHTAEPDYKEERRIKECRANRCSFCIFLSYWYFLLP